MKVEISSILKRTVCTYFFIIAHINFLFAQNSPVSPTAPSANSSSIARFGETPVSYFTGLPNIQVPIYSFKHKSVEVPINISYHASGFNPTAHPSSVGLGWTLNAGGIITRRVNQFPDEWGRSGPFIPSTSSYDDDINGYYYSKAVNTVYNWTTPEGQSIPYGFHIDRQPDVFSFNFLGINGKFFLKENGEWMVQSDRDIKIKFNSGDFHHPKLFGTFTNSNRKTFTKFTLIDENGIEYEFGTENAIEYSVGVSLSSVEKFDNNTIATAWLLKKVTFPDGNIFAFEYERGPFQINLSYFYSSREATTGDVGGNGFLSRWGVVTNTSFGIAASMISPVYLKVISSYANNLTIQFNYSKSDDLKYNLNLYKEIVRINNEPLGNINLPFTYLPLTSNISYFGSNEGEIPVTFQDYNTSKFIWLKLDGIKIMHSNTMLSRDYSSYKNVVHKSVSFKYTENPNLRLRLDGVSILDKGNVEIDKYAFNYNGWPTENYVTELTDHWGFSNGKALNYSEIYGFSEPSSPMVDKSPNYLKASIGVINEIIFPTGGKTKFWFEANDYSKVVRNFAYGTSVFDQAGIGGGLRIRRIENYDGNMLVAYKDYFYTNTYDINTGNFGSTSGVLGIEPKYIYKYRPNTQSVGQFVGNAINISSFLPGSSICAETPISYTSVYERISGGSFKQYIFTNFDNGFGDIGAVSLAYSDALPGIPVSSTYFERGHLLEENGYFSNGTLQYSVKNNYLRVGDLSSRKARSVLLDINFWYYSQYGPQNNNSVLGLAATYIYNHFFRLSSTSKTIYSVNGSNIEEKIDYGYDLRGRITNTTNLNSKNENEVISKVYATENAPENIRTYILEKNITSLPFSISKLVNGKNINRQAFNYNIFHNKFIELSSIEEFSGNQWSQSLSKSEVTKYDIYGNPLEVIDKSGLVYSYLWIYSGRHLAGIFKNVLYDQLDDKIDYEILNRPYSQEELRNHIEGLIPQFPSSEIDIFYHDIDGSLIKRIFPTGNFENYNYDDYGRLVHIKDQYGNIIKKYCYNYAGQPINCVQTFKNTQAYSGVFQKTGCGTGFVGSTVTYTVPAGTVTSIVSEADANLLAQAKVNAEGLAYANANGTCIPSAQPGTCSLTYFSPIYFPTYSLYCDGVKTTGYIVVFFPSLLNIGSTVSIGAFGSGSCKPSVNRTQNFESGGRTFSVTFNTSGVITLQLVSGSNLPGGSTIGLNSINFNL